MPFLKIDITKTKICCHVIVFISRSKRFS